VDVSNLAEVGLRLLHLFNRCWNKSPLTCSSWNKFALAFGLNMKAEKMLESCQWRKDPVFAPVSIRFAECTNKKLFYMSTYIRPISECTHYSRPDYGIERQRPWWNSKGYPQRGVPYRRGAGKMRLSTNNSLYLENGTRCVHTEFIRKAGYALYRWRPWVTVSSRESYFTCLERLKLRVFKLYIKYQPWDDKLHPKLAPIWG